MWNSISDSIRIDRASTKRLGLLQHPQFMLRIGSKEVKGLSGGGSIKCVVGRYSDSGARAPWRPSLGLSSSHVSESHHVRLHRPPALDLATQSQSHLFPVSCIVVHPQLILLSPPTSNYPATLRNCPF